MERKSNEKAPKTITFTKTSTSIPIAIIEGGTRDKEIIYLDKYVEDGSELVVDNIYHHITEKKVRSMKKYMNREELEKIRKTFEEGEEIDSDLEEICHKIKEDIKEDSKKHIHIDSGVIQVLPLMKENQVDRLYVTGASGAGKTTFIANYCIQYHKIFPKNEILLFSRKKEDPVLDTLKIIKRIRMDEKFLKLKYESSDFKDSLVIFDDIDTFSDKKISEAARALRDDLLETGRAENCYVIGVSHATLNYRSTRILLSESNKIVIFPESGGEWQIMNLMKRYFGFSPEQQRLVKKINSQWVCLNRSCPLSIIAEKDVYLL